MTAEKDGDVAYVGSDWNEGILPWEYGINLDLEEADPLLRGTVFTDRGVYKLGEEVHFKAVLRSNTPDGVRLLADGTPVFISVRDSRNKVVDERIVKVNAWSTAEWTLTVPPEGALGNYVVRAMLESDRTKPPAQETGAEEREERDYRDVQEDGDRLVPGRRVSPSGLPRGRHADGRLDDRRRSAEGRRDRPVSLRRADGQAARRTGRSRGRRSTARPPRSRRSSRPSDGPLSAIPTTDTVRSRTTWERTMRR